MTIQCKSPHRLSILGGGSDYQEYFTEKSGLIICAGINQYSQITCRYLPKYFNYKSRLSYSEVETVNDNRDIKHRAIRHTISYLGLEEKSLEIAHYSDLPSFSGTGSSSAFIVTLVNALSYLSLKKKFRPMDIARAAYHIEHNLMGETVGYQDVLAASFGGLRTFSFAKDGTIDTHELRLSTSDIEDFRNHILLLYVGIPRKASEVAKSFVPNLSKNQGMAQMAKLTEDAITAIEKKRWDVLGKLLNKNWEIKRNLSDKVSNSYLDDTYNIIRYCGAFGSKIMGAGSSGTWIVLAKPELHKKIITATGLTPIDFEFDFEGSKICES